MMLCDIFFMFVNIGKKNFFYMINLVLFFLKFNINEMKYFVVE